MTELTTSPPRPSGLYAIFSVGDRAARKLVPQGNDQIDEVYRLRMLEARPKIALRLGTVVGPAEELFWRAWVQPRVGRGLSPTQRVAAGAAAYASAHLVTRNFTLVGAAAVAGAYWGALYETGVDLESLIVSHVLWDTVILLLRPTGASRQALAAV